MGGTDDRLNGPCNWGTPAGPCGEKDTHPYKGGAFCDPHSPWARAGHPKPGTSAKTNDENETRSLHDGDQQSTPLPGAAA